MDKFEYKVITYTVRTISKIMEELNHMGSDGWEVCGIEIHGSCDKSFYFKRKIVEVALLKEQLFCDDCVYLSPKEDQQTSKKEDHVCQCAKMFTFSGCYRILYHGQYHPRIPRPDECKWYEKEELV